jgi:altered-inheritance-of-mitochondria protein 5
MLARGGNFWRAWSLQQETTSDSEPSLTSYFRASATSIALRHHQSSRKHHLSGVWRFRRSNRYQNGLHFWLCRSRKPFHCPFTFTWLIQCKAGGVTVTLGVAYLTVLAHERNRQAQAQALRSQSRVLNTLCEPEPISPPRSRAELAREERSTLTETAKDRWNEEVENAVRWVQRKDWNEVRGSLEDSVSRLLGGGLQKSREGIDEVEKQAGPKVQEAIDRSRAAGKSGVDAAAAGIDRAAAAAISGTERAGDEAKKSARKVATSSKEQLQQTGAKAADYRDAARASTDKAAAEAKTSAHDAADAIRSSGGTVDAARSAVRGVISKGIEKGREALGKAQNTIGLVEEKLGSKAQPPTLSSLSAVEKAFQERYEKRPEKSVEEALAERYKPIDAKDNTVLRGV